MHHNYVKTCNGCTQDLPGILQLFRNCAPPWLYTPKNCDNRFLLKPMKITLKIGILIILEKLWFWVDLPKFSKLVSFNWYIDHVKNLLRH